MSEIALLGAAGAIGKSIASALRAEGRSYRCIGRDMARLRMSFADDPQAELVTWNPDSPASIEQALRSVHTVIYLVGVNYWQFELHPELMRRTLASAEAAGVRNMLLIGTVYPYGRVQGGNPAREDHPREPHTFKGAMRKQQEDLLMQAHAEGRICAAILRLPDFYGPGVEASLLHSAFQAAATGKVADLIGPLDRPHEFVYVPDVGPVVLRLLGHVKAYGKSWHLAGAGVTTQMDVLAMLESQMRRKIRRRVASRIMLRMAGLFSPLLRELVEMHYLIADPLLLDDSALVALIGPIAKTPYAEGVRETLIAAGALAHTEKPPKKPIGGMPTAELGQ
ncbi:NAD-dependent epimerase/dehydratase family protein [Diaphorobacter sp. HDW4A]|uniref:NAD-dependent epimerase/dehydratase family protein n=1 Tax=Diaphorobacter sp. HDW4A TaxID=2714924 RepID=UPI0014086A69|nr:NAD-dependent epimerase/dehydratase family protein [Diaphorobacter sp. HDW4A]QIL83703.1 NAD-dependent epimerase/dehydratase family protein [Diaphorobacter sp. HDW4A]